MECRRGPTSAPVGNPSFSPFNAFPVRPDLIGVFHPDAPEDMRVSADEFFDDSPADVIEVEGAALPGELGVEDNLEEKITEVLPRVRRHPRLNGVQEFVNLLHGVPSKGIDGPWSRSQGQPFGDRRAAMTRSVVEWGRGAGEGVSRGCRRNLEDYQVIPVDHLGLD